MDASAPYPLPKRDDGRLWAIALGISLFGNIVIFGIAGFATLEAEKFRRTPDRLRAATVPKEESTVLISPDMLQAVKEEEKTAPASAEEKAAAPPLRPAAPPDFTRTSEDQRGKRPDKPMFIGERDTEATSDTTPDPNAPAMPSQRGIAPRDAADIETTESRYRDGRLEEPGSPATDPAMAPTPPAPAIPPAPDTPETPAPPNEAAAPPPAPSEGKEIADAPAPAVPEMTDLLQGPNPVDVEVPKPAPEKILPPPPPTTPAKENAAKVTPEQKPPATAKAEPKPGEPGFRGYQRKTAIRGSISRTGRSAVDVADSPLGRYQAVISRAVELEWQRNCVRHRDFITPGFLTVRFFVEATGKVKSVQFVGDMQTGEIQKGFTLNSIRDAEIPAMPKEIRGDYKDESLELIFNFYF
ncbi:hypothetical protein OVA24_01225 [Luteolibacter sp. SL250]|uniref:hypothetical protein n=1 Tax=Luteolibacter sp. SL250 TaxID=2995170 RepID=UPI00226EF851|nr:hypothetical protein [Luteolibacter sp. SL250]WAC19998.1 hypothetical protein OVA24_01225 [Luteolibacter sp. SL250]